MCNDYRLEVDIASIAEDFDDLEINLAMPEGVPNVEAREDIRITDTAPIVRSREGAALGELVNRRWSWPGPTGKPVYNYRSEKREFTCDLRPATIEAPKGSSCRARRCRRDPARSRP